MASIGGAMFAPIAGIISPSNIDAAASIMLIAGVALGGRSSLLGPALGAIAVGYGRSSLSERYPTIVDLLPGSAVHRGHPVPPRRHRLPRRRGLKAVCARREPVAGMTAALLGDGPPPSSARTPGDPRPRPSTSTGSRRSTASTSRCMQGRLHFLIGPNGAGKTTLVDALTGLVRGTGHARVPAAATCWR